MTVQKNGWSYNAEIINNIFEGMNKLILDRYN